MNRKVKITIKNRISPTIVANQSQVLIVKNLSKLSPVSNTKIMIPKTCQYVINADSIDFIEIYPVKDFEK